MRHRINRNNFGRTGSHRKAMLRNMVISLFEHRRIRTTPQKAKAARILAEKMITLAKKHHLATETKDKLHYRRLAISRLADRAAVKALFDEIGPQYVDRNGGYTRIMRLPGMIRLSANEMGTRQQSNWRRAYGWRLGDGAEQCLLELVEAEVAPKQRSRKKKGGKRRRRREEEEPETAAEEQAAEAVETEEAEEAEADESEAEEASPEAEAEIEQSEGEEEGEEGEVEEKSE